MQLNKILKSLLQKRGLSITSLSKDTGIPIQTLHNWLNGAEPRSFSQVKRVADYFEITLDEICYGIKPSNELIDSYEDEINAGVFEVVLRRIKK